MLGVRYQYHHHLSHDIINHHLVYCSRFTVYFALLGKKAILSILIHDLFPISAECRPKVVPWNATRNSSNRWSWHLHPGCIADATDRYRDYVWPFHMSPSQVVLIEPWHQNSGKSNQHTKKSKKLQRPHCALAFSIPCVFFEIKTPVVLNSTWPRCWKLHSCLEDMSCWVLRLFQPTGETDPVGTKIIDFRKWQKRMASTSIKHMTPLQKQKLFSLEWYLPNDIGPNDFDQVANTGRKRSCHWRFISAAWRRVAWGET